ncbi:hypothetical protein AUC71_05585 [Methyloceanibacter marginalis]|uniref:Autotransporter domain-containing protein n=2 Tax=Methyloceanibacter marginalis TaxID=1774971 RepID=A0A1E3WGI8_9HYPH|nr:hypothetical protein AUC71_05585 [Methyloceanibacter marginalis]
MPASAVETCGAFVGTGPDPIILINPGDAIDCVNTEDRDGDTGAGTGSAIELETDADVEYIKLDTIGTLTASDIGIRTETDGENSTIHITNRGDIFAGTRGISAFVNDYDSAITIVNSGDISVTAPGSSFRNYGIYAREFGGYSPINITNSGAITVTSPTESATGIYGSNEGNYGGVTILNSGAIAVNGANRATGIRGESAATGNAISIDNRAKISATSDNSAFGISGYSELDESPVIIRNSGTVTVRAGNNGYGLYAYTVSDDSRITITNSGKLGVTADYDGFGVFAKADADSGAIKIENNGDVAVTTNIGRAYGIYAYTHYDDSPIRILNSGSIAVAGQYSGSGISAVSGGTNSPVSVENRASIDVNAQYDAIGITARTVYANSPVKIANHGDITVTSQEFCPCGFSAYGIDVVTFGANNSVTITNTAAIKAAGPSSVGVSVVSFGPSSPILINNAGGSIFGGSAGIFVDNTYSSTTIVNSGDIGASNNRAVVGYYGPVDIFNTGTITGFVLLDADDRFINQAGGVFEARQTSDFDAYGPGGANDLFRNEAGGTVHAADDITRAETTRFVNLERFENSGLISLVDNRPGDSFTISNTPGGTDLKFDAGSGSRLAVDAHLGGPGSRSDTFTIEGDVSGVTRVSVVNTNYGPGVFNPSGMRVVTVTGATPNPDAFKLDESIDTGFFNYDLFFTPTGSGHWDLRSFAGPGAFLLPQLVTAAQDIWHQSASTWFDRTADLRVLLAGGPAPTAYDPGGKSLSAAEPYALTPAVWARGSGSWLDRDGTERTTAYGRDYTFDMDRDLQTLDFQVGVDLGKRDALTQGDALVFGLLGGLVHGDLDYDALARNFNFDGGQVGVYATYLNGGLFVDTLANLHLYSLETSTLGFPSSLDANTVGLRTDTGYRFGSFSGGPFLEPLATLEVTWADIDGFSLGGNTVSFDDDANVRGRLGLRAGTTMAAWEGTLMEPFVTGSLWGNLTDDNSATLVSTGRTFRFEDQLEDVWGESRRA